MSVKCGKVVEHLAFDVVSVPLHDVERTTPWEPPPPPKRGEKPTPVPRRISTKPGKLAYQASEKAAELKREKRKRLRAKKRIKVFGPHPEPRVPLPATPHTWIEIFTEIVRIVNLARIASYEAMLLANFHIRRLLDKGTPLEKIDSFLFYNCLRLVAIPPKNRVPVVAPTGVDDEDDVNEDVKYERDAGKHPPSTQLRKSAQLFLALRNSDPAFKRELLDLTGYSCLFPRYARDMFTMFQNHLSANINRVVRRYCVVKLFDLAKADNLTLSRADCRKLAHHTYRKWAHLKTDFPVSIKCKDKVRLVSYAKNVMTDLQHMFGPSNSGDPRFGTVPAGLKLNGDKFVQVFHGILKFFETRDSEIREAEELRTKELTQLRIQDMSSVLSEMDSASDPADKEDDDDDDDDEEEDAIEHWSSRNVHDDLCKLESFPWKTWRTHNVRRKLCNVVVTAIESLGRLRKKTDEKRQKVTKPVVDFIARQKRKGGNDEPLTVYLLRYIDDVVQVNSDKKALKDVKAFNLMPLYSLQLRYVTLTEQLFFQIGHKVFPDGFPRCRRF